MKGLSMNKINLVLRYVLIILGLFLLMESNIIAENSKDVAVVLKSKGKVSIKKIAANKWYRSRRGQRLNSGDIIKTEKNSLAAVMFTDDKSLIKVRDNSTVAIKGKREKKSIAKRIFCSVGSFWLRAKKQKTKLFVETPSGVAAVKGSAAYFTISPDETKVMVTDGIFQLWNKFGEIFVNIGETGRLTRNGKPIKYKTTVEEIDAAGPEDEGEDEKLVKELRLKFKDDQGEEKDLIIKYKEKK